MYGNCNAAVLFQFDSVILDPNVHVYINKHR